MFISRRWLWRLSIATLFLPSNRAAADIVVGTRFREVYTEAASVGFFVIDGATSTSGGVFNDMATSLEVEPTFGTFSATAAQNSTIPNLTGPAMSGSGSVAASALHLVTSSVGVANGDAVFDVRFTVDVAGSYDFSGSVSYSEVHPFGPGGATLSFANLTTLSGLAFLQRSDTNPGVATANSTLVLNPGNTYRLYATAVVTGNDFNDQFIFPQSSSSNASWSFSLAPTTAVPEASAFLATGLAACLAAVGRGCIRGMRRA